MSELTVQRGPESHSRKGSLNIVNETWKQKKKHHAASSIASSRAVGEESAFCPFLWQKELNIPSMGC